MKSTEGMCSEYSAQTEMDLSSSLLRDECKQTILRRINVVESTDNIQSVCVTVVVSRKKKKQLSLLVM